MLHTSNMTHHFYSNLLGDLIQSDETHRVVAEETSPYRFLTEKHLQILWQEQKYFTPLFTESGLPIEVLSQGIWNTESGPSFLNAHLKIGDHEFKGDIDVHLSEDSWYAHKHHLHEAYAHVILHVSYWKPKKKKVLVTQENREIHCIPLETFLTLSEAELTKLIDIELYPYNSFSGSGRCSRSLFEQLSVEEAIKIFRSAAAWRLLQKKELLHAKSTQTSDLLKTGIALALGYKQNSQAFLDLFRELNLSRDRDEEWLLAKALGLCNYFAPFYQQKWEDSAYYQTLLAKYLLMPDCKDFSPIKLHLNNIRPSNHPVRRLALLVKLVRIQDLSANIKAIQKCWETSWDLHQWRKLRNNIVEQLPIFNDLYWEHHYTFEKKRQEQSIALMGEALYREITINVCLPIIYEGVTQRRCKEEGRAFQLFYASLPAIESRKGQYLSHRFFGETGKRTLLFQADTQQGAYQLHRDFCVHFEENCEGCTFVDRYYNFFNHST